MNAKQILIATAIVTTMTVAAALAQTAPTAAPATAAPAATAAEGSHGKGRHEMKFEDRKAHALKRLEKSAASIQQKQACVQASTDKDSLQACFPKRGQGKGNGGWHKHAAKGGAGKTDSGAAPAADAPAEQ